MVIAAAAWLTNQDYHRVNHLLSELTRMSKELQAGVVMLEETLRRARVVHQEKVPQNVVTMNSRVVFTDAHTREDSTVTVVYPANADAAVGHISVLSPVGAALLGVATGQEVALPLPHGRHRRIHVRDVLYQPEAHGHFDL
jgi:regulator of nucleoside diphosphate kinase